KRLADSGEFDDGARVFAPFDVIDGLPVGANEFSNAFLGEVGSETRGSDVSPDHPQNLTVCHPPFETSVILLLTSNMFDIKSVGYTRAKTSHDPNHYQRKDMNRNLKPVTFTAIAVVLVGCDTVQEPRETVAPPPATLEYKLPVLNPVEPDKQTIEK